MIATFSPIKLFINVDFPTLGRPINATKPERKPSSPFKPFNRLHQATFPNHCHK